jgi:hypothetical protein
VRGIARVPLDSQPEKCAKFPDISELRDVSVGIRLLIVRFWLQAVSSKSRYSPPPSADVASTDPTFLFNTTCEVSSPQGPNNISSSS